MLSRASSEAVDGGSVGVFRRGAGLVGDLRCPGRERGHGEAGELGGAGAELRFDDRHVEVDVYVDDRSVVLRPKDGRAPEHRGLLGRGDAHPLAGLRSRHGPLERLSVRCSPDARNGECTSIEGAEERFVHVDRAVAATAVAEPGERVVDVRREHRREQRESRRGEGGRVARSDSAFFLGGAARPRVEHAGQVERMRVDGRRLRGDVAFARTSSSTDERERHRHRKDPGSHERRAQGKVRARRRAGRARDGAALRGLPSATQLASHSFGCRLAQLASTGGRRAHVSRTFRQTIRDSGGASRCPGAGGAGRARCPTHVSAIPHISEARRRSARWCAAC